jgi:hypothetical protein
MRQRKKRSTASWKRLGADFEAAWTAGDGVDENSADGKA